MSIFDFGLLQSIRSFELFAKPTFVLFVCAFNILSLNVFLFIFREDCSADDLIDVIVGNRVYMPCLYVYNKVDQISIEELDRLARIPHTVVISCNLRLNLDYLIEKIWEHLNLIKVFTKKRGQKPDLSEGIILRNGASVSHVCHSIHRTMIDSLKYALVWGTSVKFNPQRVGPNHIMHHEDVIQIVSK